MKNIDKKESLYKAVSDIDAGHVEDFIRYENTLPEKTAKSSSYHPMLRLAGAFAVCAVIFGGIFAGLKYLEYKGGRINNTPETSSSDTPDETGAETNGKTETTEEAETTEETEKETETENAAETDGQRIDGIADAIAAGDNSDQMWDALKSFGDAAFDHLVKRYFDKETTSEVKAVISVFVSETVKDEITKVNNFNSSDLEFPDRTALDGDRKPLYSWLSTFRTKAKHYAEYRYEKEAVSKIPYTCRMLLLTDEDPFLYDPTGVDVSVLLDKAISENFNTRNAHIIYNYLAYMYKYTAFQYFVDNYFTETDAMRRTAMSWAAYEIILPEASDLLGHDRSISIYRGTVDYDVTKDWSIKAHADLVEPFIQKYTEEVKDIAKNMLEDEVRDEYPFTYKLLSSVGFDGYKPGEPDIAFRSRKAVKAASQLYQAVKYGWVPDELIENCLPVEDYMRQELTERTKDDVFQYLPEEDFRSYFEKYIDKSIIDNACKTQNAWFTIKSGRVYMFDGGPQSSLSIDHRSAKLSEKNGDTYVIRADVTFPYGMFSFTRNLTFEVKEYKDGVRLTGGAFTDRILTPEYAAVNYLASVLNMYLRLREGQTKFSSSTICRYYYSYDEVPEKYRNVLTEDMEYPLYYGENLTYDSIGFNFEHGATEEIQNAILRKTDVFDGVALYPQHATVKHTPKFDYEFDFQIAKDEIATFSIILGYDIALGMNVIESTPDRLYISLDFTKEENGGTEDVTYTFEMKTEYDTENPNNPVYYVLTGGTFVTDVIMAK